MDAAGHAPSASVPEGAPDSMRIVRVLFWAVAVTIPMLFAVLILALPAAGTGDAPTSLVVAGVLVFGVSTVGVSRLTWNLPLDSSSAETLAASFRSRYIVAISLAEAAMLGGLVGSILTGQRWMFLLGAAIGLAGLLPLVPSRRLVDERQQELTRQGSPLSLQDALELRVEGPEPF